MSKIISLRATNYKRLKAVEITPDPDGNLVVVAGRNAQGKSSVLDAISAALGGVNKKETPKPIRHGEDYAEIVLETDELIVERRFTGAKSTLVVSRHDGSKYPAPQQKLDDLIGRLSLDPLKFIHLDDKKQREALLELVDLPYDPDALEAERQRIYDRRTEAGRARKALGEPAVNDELPVEEQSAGELISRIQAAEKHNRSVELTHATAAQIEADIARLESQLEEARRQLNVEYNRAETLGGLVDVSALQAQLETVEQSNAAIRANNEARAKAVEHKALTAEREKLTAELERLDKTKAEGLAAATMAVEGLGFDDHGVTYNGQPLRQASSAEQLRVSLAMAIALNPELRVIRIADGSLLDDENLALIREMAAEHDAQIWLEVVGDGDGTGVIIEDGEVVA